MDNSLPIKVLMGGVSREREVSLKSGEAVFHALIKKGFNAQKYVVDDERLDGITPENCHVAFIALHGKFGEDGQVQQILEDRGIKYTGSGPEGSINAMDKSKSKSLFVTNNIPTARYRTVSELGDYAAIIESLGLPLFVKPANEGSSIGVSKVRKPDELAPAIAEALSLSSPVIVEEFIEGREMTVGILGEEALPIVEMKPEREFYDYTAKYAQGSGTQYTLETGLSAEEIRRFQDVALRAHKCLGCRGVSRVDFILTESGKPMVLEVNTIPGMTERSLLPKAAAGIGIDFPDLCERIVMMAIK